MNGWVSNPCPRHIPPNVPQENRSPHLDICWREGIKLLKENNTKVKIYFRSVLPFSLPQSWGTGTVLGSKVSSLSCLIYRYSFHMVRCVVRQDKVEPTSCPCHPTTTRMTVPGFFIPGDRVEQRSPEGCLRLSLAVKEELHSAHF